MEQFQFIGHIFILCFPMEQFKFMGHLIYFVFSYGTAGLPKPYKIVCIFFLGITQFQND